MHPLHPLTESLLDPKRDAFIVAERDARPLANCMVRLRVRLQSEKLAAGLYPCVRVRSPNIEHTLSATDGSRCPIHISISGTSQVDLAGERANATTVIRSIASVLNI